MRVEAIVEHAKELGITLTIAGDKILYRPKSSTPPEFVEMLRKYKPEVIDYFRRDELVIEAEIVQFINCNVCRTNRWWLRHDKRWVCHVCHPQPPTSNNGDSRKCR